MKKSAILAFAMGVLAFTACSEKKAPQAPQKPAQEEVIKDPAFQKAAAGDYKSPDGKRIITLNSDFTVKTTNFDKEYYKWALLTKPEVSAVTIELIRKGLDTDITEQATLDVNEGSLLIKNETFRKPK